MELNRRTLTAGLAALAGGMAAGQAKAQDGEGLARDLTVVQRPIYQLSPGRPSALRVSTTLDHANNVYFVGQDVRMSVRVNRDAYITVINVGSSGRTTVLFPNAIDMDNRVLANQLLVLPTDRSWAIQVGGPPGIEVLKVFASVSPKSVFDHGVFEPTGPFRSFREGGNAAARDLSVVFNSPATPTASDDWNSATRLFRVLDR